MKREKRKLCFKHQRKDHYKKLPNSHKSKPKTTISNIRVNGKEIKQKQLKIEDRSDKREQTSTIQEIHNDQLPNSAIIMLKITFQQLHRKSMQNQREK